MSRLSVPGMVAGIIAGGVVVAIAGLGRDIWLAPMIGTGMGITIILAYEWLTG